MLNIFLNDVRDKYHFMPDTWFTVENNKGEGKIQPIHGFLAPQSTATKRVCVGGIVVSPIDVTLTVCRSIIGRHFHENK